MQKNRLEWSGPAATRWMRVDTRRQRVKKLPSGVGSPTGSCRPGADIDAASPRRQDSARSGSKRVYSVALGVAKTSQVR
jgi:hypothetical protein